MTYEPDPNAQSDIEATEWIRSRSQQRQALVENQMQMLLKEVRSLKAQVAQEQEARHLAEEQTTTQIETLRDELVQQRRVTAQLMRERVA